MCKNLKGTFDQDNYLNLEYSTKIDCDYEMPPKLLADLSFAQYLNEVYEVIVKPFNMDL